MMSREIEAACVLRIRPAISSIVKITAPQFFNIRTTTETESFQCGYSMKTYSPLDTARAAGTREPITTIRKGHFLTLTKRDTT